MLRAYYRAAGGRDRKMLAAISITETTDLTLAEAVEVVESHHEDHDALTALLATALADAYTVYFRAHSAHWNVKGPAFGPFHELFGQIASDVYGSVDDMAENILRLGVDAPSSLDELIMRRTIDPASVSDDPLSLAQDLARMNEQMLMTLKAAFEEANECNEQGVCNFLADRLDMHKKWAWQLSRTLSVPTEPPVTSPVTVAVVDMDDMEPDEDDVMDALGSMLDDACDCASCRAARY